MPIRAAAPHHWQMSLHKVRKKPALLSSTSHFLQTITFSLVLSLRLSQSTPLCINHFTFLSPDPSLSFALTPACQCFIRRDVLLSVPVTSLIASPSNQLCPNEFYWQPLNAYKQLCATSRGSKADLRAVKSNGNAQAEQLIHHSLHHIHLSYCPGASIVVSHIYPSPQSENSQ